MRVALYHPWLKSRGGAERVLLEIMKRSRHETALFTLFYDEDGTFPGFSTEDIQVIGSNTPPRGFVDKALRFGFGSLFAKLPLEGYDRFVVSEAGLGSLITFRNNEVPTLCYCHTPLRATLPMFQDRYRGEQHVLVKPFYWLGQQLYSFLEKRAWNHFSQVLANSALTKRRIVEKGLLGEDQITVLHPGVDIDAFEPGAFQPFFLYPSRFRRYKQQHLAIEAFIEADLPDDFKLVLAGAAQEEEYVRELREMAEGEAVDILTDVSGERWKQLYEEAYGVLFLAENEDWGIVPLEAMAAGKPVIAVNEGGFTDVVMDGETGFLVPPTRSAVADALTRLAADTSMAEEMGERGRQTVDTYSWNAFITGFDRYVEEYGE